MILKTVINYSLFNVLIFVEYKRIVFIKVLRLIESESNPPKVPFSYLSKVNTLRKWFELIGGSWDLSNYH